MYIVFRFCKCEDDAARLASNNFKVVAFRCYDLFNLGVVVLKVIVFLPTKSCANDTKKFYDVAEFVNST